MLLKKEQNAREKTKGCAEGHYHPKFNHKLVLSSHIVTSCLYLGSYVMNTFDYNYKLKSVIGQENDFTTNKWKWFDTQVCDTFLWSCLISRSLVDYTNMSGIISRILDNVCVLSMPTKDSIGSITSHFCTSMVVPPRSNDHLRIHNLIYENMISSSSKKQRNVPYPSYSSF